MARFLALPHLLAALGFAALLLVGCYPVTPLQSARTLPRKETQTSFSVTVVPSYDLRHSTMATPDVMVRQGIADGWDVGLRLRVLGVSADVKHQLVRGKFDLALDLGATCARDETMQLDQDEDSPGDQASVCAGHPTLLFGTSADEPVVLTLAAGLHAGVRIEQFDYSDGVSGDHRSADGHALFLAPVFGMGVQARVSDSVSLLIAFAMLIPVAGAEDASELHPAARGTLRLGPGDSRGEASVGVAVDF